MSELQDKLKRDRARFNRKVRRFAITVSAAVVLIGGVLGYLYLWEGDGKQQGPGSRISPQDISDPTVVPTADPDDPSQLVLPGLLMSEQHAWPEQETPAGKRTKVDLHLLTTVLETVKMVPQDELEARVDPTIQWEDFNDPRRRERARGRLCRFQGTLRRFTETKGVDISESGIENFYEGQLQDKYGRWFSFYCIEEPEQEIKRTEIATLTGVFYKLIRYTARGGEEIISPLIIARTITARRGYQEPVTAGRRVPEWLIYVGLAAGAIVVCIILHYLMKRRPTRYERRQR